MNNDAESLKQFLRQKAGLSSAAISAAWPSWWTDAADSSPSAQADLRFSLARKLGLDSRSILDNKDSPVFIWDESAKFKDFLGDDHKEKSVMTSFGVSVSRILLSGSTQKETIVGESASHIRSSILKSQSSVGLVELLSLLWGVGIPLIHLRVHPLATKKMRAMAVQVDGKFAILLACDDRYPARLIFYIAHEIAHIALGHLNHHNAIVDMEDSNESHDAKELAADEFALELLTGQNEPQFSINDQEPVSAEQLADFVQIEGSNKRIEQGILALCYGYVSQNWGIVDRAIQHIYGEPQDSWKVINKMAMDQIFWDKISDDNSYFIQAILGDCDKWTQ